MYKSGDAPAKLLQRAALPSVALKCCHVLPPKKTLPPPPHRQVRLRSNNKYANMCVRPETQALRLHSRDKSEWRLFDGDEAQLLPLLQLNLEPKATSAGAAGETTTAAAVVAPAVPGSRPGSESAPPVPGSGSGSGIAPTEPHPLARPAAGTVRRPPNAEEEQKHKAGILKEMKRLRE